MGGDHICPICFGTFTRPQHVGRHMRSHTGDKPYECQQCPDRFARSDLLSRHVQKTHGDGVSAKIRKIRKTSTSSSETKPPLTTRSRRNSDGQRLEQDERVQERLRRASGGGTVWEMNGMQEISRGRQEMGQGFDPRYGMNREQVLGGMAPRQILPQQNGGMPWSDQAQLILGQEYIPLRGEVNGLQYQELEVDEDEDDWADSLGHGASIGVIRSQQFPEQTAITNPVLGQTASGNPMLNSTGYMASIYPPPIHGQYTGPPMSQGTPWLHASPDALQSDGRSPGSSSRGTTTMNAPFGYTPVEPVNLVPYIPQTLTMGGSTDLLAAPQVALQPGYGWDSASPAGSALLMPGSLAVDSPGSNYLSPSAGSTSIQHHFAMQTPSMGSTMSDSGSTFGSGYLHVAGSLQDSPSANTASLSPVSQGGRASSERPSTSNLVLGHLPPEGSIAIVPPPNGISTRSPHMKKHRACERCNQSKVKCDFGTPCHKCAARGLSCSYPSARKASVARVAKHTDPAPVSNGNATNANKLEGVSTIYEAGTINAPANAFVSTVDDVELEPSQAYMSAQDMARLADGRRASITGQMGIHKTGTSFVEAIPVPMLADPTIQVFQAYPSHVPRTTPAFSHSPGQTSYAYREAGNQVEPEPSELYSADDSDSYVLSTVSQSRRTSLASSFLEEAAAMAIDPRSDVLEAASVAQAQQRQQQAGAMFASLQGVAPSGRVRVESGPQVSRPGNVRMPSLQDVKDAWRRTYLPGKSGTSIPITGHATGQEAVATGAQPHLTASAKPKARPGLVHRGRSSSSPPVFLNPNTMAHQVGMSGLTPRAVADQPFDFGQYGYGNPDYSAGAGMSASEWNDWSQGPPKSGFVDPLMQAIAAAPPIGAISGAIDTARQDSLAVTQAIPAARPIAGVLQSRNNTDLRFQVIGGGVAQTLAPERAPSFNLISPGNPDFSLIPRVAARSSPLRPSFVGYAPKTTSQFTRPGNKRLASQNLAPENAKVQSTGIENPGMATSGSWDSIGSGPNTPTSMFPFARRNSVPGWLGSLDQVTSPHPNGGTPGNKSFAQPYPFMTPSLMDSMSAEYGFPGVEFATPTTTGQFSFMS